MSTMEYVHIKSRPLRRFLLKYYDADKDGQLSAADLEGVEFLEITTLKMQLWDESPELSLVTRWFLHPDDLRKLPNLKCLVISAQPVFRILLPQKSLKEVSIIHCPLSKISVCGEKASRKKGGRQIDWISPDHPMRDSTFHR